MTLVVRSKYFLRFFFQPVHLHGELAYFPGVLVFLVALGLELLPKVILALVVEDNLGLVEELPLPVTEQVRLDLVLYSQRVEVFLAFEQLDDEIGFELGSKMAACTGHDESPFNWYLQYTTRFIIKAAGICLNSWCHYKYHPDSRNECQGNHPSQTDNIHRNNRSFLIHAF